MSQPLLETFGGFSGFKFRLIMIAMFVIAIGLFIDVGKKVSESNSRERSWNEGSAARSSLMEKADTWGQAMTRIGIAFLTALILACLLRAFFKTMLILLACSVAVIAFLHFRRMIEPFWEPYLMSGREMKAWIASETGSIVGFLRGYFPVVASVLVGFVFGIRR